MRSKGVTLRVLPWGVDCTVRIGYRVHRPVDDVVFGIAWHAVDGTLVGGHNTDIDGVGGVRLVEDGVVSCHYPALHLAPGDYLLDIAVHRADGLAHDYWCQAARVRVEAGAGWPGVWAPPHSWSLDERDRDPAE